MKTKPKKAVGQSRHTNRFRRTEAKRLVQAALDAGLIIGRVEVDPKSGTISVIPGKPEHEQANALDKWMEKHAH
jgi:hypothetical protein